MNQLHVAMSLDGFIAGANNDMSWTEGAEYDTASDLAGEVAGATGAILCGRGWYDVGKHDEGGAVAGIYGGEWSGPVVLVTHDPDLIPDQEIETATDFEAGLSRAEDLAGVKNLGIFGGEIAKQALELGRLDEIIVQLVPIVLGDGIPLFGSAPRPRVSLERTYSGTSGDLTEMRFRVLR